MTGEPTPPGDVMEKVSVAQSPTSDPASASVTTSQMSNRLNPTLIVIILWFKVDIPVVMPGAVVVRATGSVLGPSMSNSYE